MWKPDSLGDVVAERQITVWRGRKSDTMTVRFGRPVHSTNGQDPWWTPLSISGCGVDLFRSIAGQDSLQSLLLALDHATELLAQHVRQVGDRADWLGEPERLILARQAMSKASADVITSLLGRLKGVAALLDSGGTASRKKRVRAVDLLDDLGASVGHWSARALERKKRRSSRRRKK